MYLPSEQLFWQVDFFGEKVSSTEIKQFFHLVTVLTGNGGMQFCGLPDDKIFPGFVYRIQESQLAVYRIKKPMLKHGTEAWWSALRSTLETPKTQVYCWAPFLVDCLLTREKTFPNPLEFDCVPQISQGVEIRIVDQIIGLCGLKKCRRILCAHL